MRPLRLLLPAFPLLLSLLLPLAAQAGEPFWQVDKGDKNANYKALLISGDEFAAAAANARSLAHPRAFVQTTAGRQRSEALAQSLARKAIASYEAAAKANPTSEVPHYRAGEALNAFMVGVTIPAPSDLDRAIEHWRQFEKKAPLDPRLPRILDERAIALTKRGGKENLLAAVVDYDRQLNLVDQSSDARGPDIARLLSNRAEIYMMLGDLRRSIAGYENALKLDARTTYGYGLAVALDRDKQGVRARNIAAQYAATDSNNALADTSNTFFVPAGERYYYIAMRAEGLKDYRAAVSAYKQFLRLWRGSPWAAQARANLKDLIPKAAKQPKETTKPNRPKRFNWIP